MVEGQHSTSMAWMCMWITCGCRFSFSRARSGISSKRQGMGCCAGSGTTLCINLSKSLWNQRRSREQAWLVCVCYLVFFSAPEESIGNKLKWLLRHCGLLHFIVLSSRVQGIFSFVSASSTSFSSTLNKCSWSVSSKTQQQQSLLTTAARDALKGFLPHTCTIVLFPAHLCSCDSSSSPSSLWSWIVLVTCCVRRFGVNSWWLWP